MSWIRLIKEGRKLITLNKLPFDAVKQNKKLFNVNNNRYCKFWWFNSNLAR